jgi:hypothetical protein
MNYLSEIVHLSLPNSVWIPDVHKLYQKFHQNQFYNLQNRLYLLLQNSLVFPDEDLVGHLWPLISPLVFSAKSKIDSKTRFQT